MVTRKEKTLQIAVRRSVKKRIRIFANKECKLSNEYSKMFV